MFSKKNKKGNKPFYENLTMVLFSWLYFHTSIWWFIYSVAFYFEDGNSRRIEEPTFESYLWVADWINKQSLIGNIILLFFFIFIFIFGCWVLSCKKSTIEEQFYEVHTSMEKLPKFNWKMGTILFLLGPAMVLLFIIRTTIAKGLIIFENYCTSSSITFIPWIAGTVIVLLSMGIILYSKWRNKNA